MGIYFAYGSNIVETQMASRCRSARLIAPAVLRGYRFSIVRCGYASIVPQRGGITYGTVWQIRPPDRRRLDAYEQTNDGLYRRCWLPVSVVGGGTRIALVYIATDLAPGRPRRGYLEPIMEAASHYSFPPATIAEFAKWRGQRSFVARQLPYRPKVSRSASATIP